MSIMQRLVFSQIVVLISLLVIGGGGLLQLNQAHDRFINVQEETLPSLELVQRSKAALSEQRIVLHKAMLEKDPARLTEMADASREAAEARKTALTRYAQQMVSDDTERKQLGDALHASQAYTAMAEQVFSLLRADQRDAAAERVLHGKEDATAAGALDQLVAYNHAQARLLREAGDAASARARWVALTVMAVALSLNLWLAVSLQRAVRQGVRGIRDTSSEVAESLNFTRRAAILRMDEMGQTGTAFNSLL